MDATLAPMGRVVGVRLLDIPIRRRRAHGRRLVDAAIADRDLLLAAALTAAIEEPSDRVYWIPERAYRRVMGT